VVAIGLSSGFLEPLESTSIHLIQSGIAKLLTLWPDRDMDGGLAARYNQLLNADMDVIKDFLILHYHATERTEPFWAERRAMALPETLATREAAWRRSARLMLDGEELFRETSWIAVLDGQGVTAGDYNPLADTLDAATNRAQVRQIAELIARAAATLPKHDTALAAAMQA
jgi:tryptophan 7-halogenase